MGLRTFRAWTFRSWTFRDAATAGPRPPVGTSGAPVFSFSFERALLAQLIPFLSTLILHLFINDLDPTPDDNAAFYEEPAEPWYEPQPLDSWSSVVTDAQGRAVSYHDFLIFENTTGPTRPVYGYFVTDELGRFCYAERDPDAPFSLRLGGSAYRLQPKFTLRPCPELH